MRSSIEFRSGALSALQAGLQGAFREHMALAEDGAVDLAQAILRDAVRLAPVHSGRLRKSGKVFRRKPRKPSFHLVKIRFGSKRRAKRSKRGADYAAIVHFNMNLKHRAGGPLYLHHAVGKHAANLPAHIRTKWKVR